MSLDMASPVRAAPFVTESKGVTFQIGPEAFPAFDDMVKKLGVSRSALCKYIVEQVTTDINLREEILGRAYKGALMARASCGTLRRSLPRKG